MIIFVCIHRTHTGSWRYICAIRVPAMVFPLLSYSCNWATHTAVTCFGSPDMQSGGRVMRGPTGPHLDKACLISLKKRLQHMPVSVSAKICFQARPMSSSPCCPVAPGFDSLPRTTLGWLGTSGWPPSNSNATVPLLYSLCNVEVHVRVCYVNELVIDSSTRTESLSPRTR